MDNNLEELKQIIIKANPSILDLKFGCKVKTETVVIEGKIIRSLSNDRVEVLVEGINNQIILKNQIAEILGRDIILSDVLVALRKKNLKIAIVVEENNLIINYWDSKPAFKFPRNTCNWIPKKPLHEQSKETIEFLYELLK